MINRSISIIFLMIAICLMLLPNAIPTYWVYPESSSHVIYVSYFDDILRIARENFFSADETHRSTSINFFPIITALFTIYIFLRLIIDSVLIFTKKRKEDAPGKSIIICLILCIVMSLLSYFIYNTISFVVIIIFILHITVLTLQVMLKLASRKTIAELRKELTHNKPELY